METFYKATLHHSLCMKISKNIVEVAYSFSRGQFVLILVLASLRKLLKLRSQHGFMNQSSQQPIDWLQVGGNLTSSSTEELGMTDLISVRRSPFENSVST